MRSLQAVKMQERGPLEDGSKYNKYYGKPPGEVIVIKKGAKLTDTLQALPRYVKMYAHQADLVSGTLEDFDGDLVKTCQNIWHHFHYCFGYKADPQGVETIQSLWHLWWAPQKKGDCDCLSFGISCVLKCLKIGHLFRVTENEPDAGFGHIYVVVPYKGREIIIDACMDDFNTEATYTKKTEVPMDLEFLNGLGSIFPASSGGSTIDADDLLSYQLPPMNGDGSVGKLKLFEKIKETFHNTAQNVKNDVHNAGQDIKKAAQKTGKAISQGVHVINRVNPATTALRLGLLSGLKLNLLGVAGELRYAYLSDEEAQKRGLNMARFDRYKKLRTKLEKIFFNAGGKPENLKEAILSGKGNQDKAVQLSGVVLANKGFSGDSKVSQILGEQMYWDEIPERETLNGLGVVATAAVIASATGVLATIAGILKNIGSVLKGGDPGTDAGMDTLDQQADSVAQDDGSNTRQSTTTSADSTGTDSGGAGTGTSTDSTSTDSTDTGGGATSPDGGGSAPPPAEPTKFMDNPIQWAKENPKKAIGVGIGVVATAVGGFFLYRKFSGKKSERKEKRENGSRAEDLHGVSHAAHKSHRRVGRPRKHSKVDDDVLRELKLSRLK